MVSQAGEEKKQIPLWLAAVAAVLLLAFMGWWGYKNFGPQDPPLTAKNIEVQKMIEDLATKSGGDWSKLTPEEQEKMRGVAGPMAPTVLKSNVKK